MGERRKIIKYAATLEFIKKTETLSALGVLNSEWIMGSPRCFGRKQKQLLYLCRHAWCVQEIQEIITKRAKFRPTMYTVRTMKNFQIYAFENEKKKKNSLDWERNFRLDREWSVNIRLRTWLARQRDDSLRSRRVDRGNPERHVLFFKVRPNKQRARARWNRYFTTRWFIPRYVTLASPFFLVSK